MVAASDISQSRTRHLIAEFLRDQAGATAIEYGLIAAMICVAVILGMSATGTSVNELYDTNKNCVVNAIDNQEGCD